MFTAALTTDKIIDIQNRKLQAQAQKKNIAIRHGDCQAGKASYINRALTIFPRNPTSEAVYRPMLPENASKGSIPGVYWLPPNQTGQSADKSKQKGKAEDR